MRNAKVFIFIAAIVALVPACGKNDGRVKVYPVQGKVLVHGAPAEGARVVFYPVSEELKKPGMPVPAGTTDAHGTFKLKSYSAEDGAPQGEFKVTVIWLEPMPEGADPDTFSRKDRLEDQFADPQKTRLTAMVEPRDNQLKPFELP